MFKHILVPTDGSKLSAKAERAATKLAAGLGGRVTGLYVLPQTIYDFVGDVVATRVVSVKEAREREMKARKSVFRNLEKAAAVAGVICSARCVTSDDTYRSIIDAARKSRCDAIVMASHGRRGLSGLVLGSETHKVLTHSTIPVLVCR
jgi:nucleotide-binding universal stress UspA family protein